MTVHSIFWEKSDTYWNMDKTIETFMTSATLEIRWLPGIDSALAARIAQTMLREIRERKCYGSEADIISREDHLSISIENVELSEMTPAAYAEILGRLRAIAEQMTQSKR